MTRRPVAYTIAECADLLGVSRYVIRREIAEGRLPTVKLASKVVRVPAVAIDAMVASAMRAVEG